MQSGNSNIIERLFSSFTELEQAIESAKCTLAKKESVPPALLHRLNSYDSILSKQRNLATTLCEHINAGNWDEVARHVGLINGLSAMIRDDARAILSSLAADNVSTADGDEDLNFC